MIDIDAVEAHLEHYGVKGMHWGVRKRRSAPVKKSAERKRAETIEQKHRQHGKQALTNKEIADYTKRVELERKLSQVTAKPKKKNPITEGHNFVRNVLAIGATINAVIAFSNSPAGRALGRKLARAAAKASKSSGGPKRASAEIVRLALPAGHDDLVGDFLEHHGVKGMKWGVRKERDASGRRSGASVGFVGTESTAWPPNPKLAGKKSADKIMSDVVPQLNPRYPRGMGTNMNCRRCTFAYELARRGYDVKATENARAEGQHAGGMYNVLHPELGKKDFLPLNEMKTWRTQVKGERREAKGKETSDYFKKLKESNLGAGAHVGHPDQILKDIAKEGNGTRGEITITMDVGFKHSMAYEVIGGKAVIIDAQRKKKYTDIREIDKEIGAKTIDSGYTRLDNAPLNELFLKQWVVPNGSK